MCPIPHTHSFSSAAVSSLSWFAEVTGEVFLWPALLWRANQTHLDPPRDLLVHSHHPQHKCTQHTGEFPQSARKTPGENICCFKKPIKFTMFPPLFLNLHNIRCFHCFATNTLCVHDLTFCQTLGFEGFCKMMNGSFFIFRFTDFHRHLRFHNFTLSIRMLLLMHQEISQRPPDTLWTTSPSTRTDLGFECLACSSGLTCGSSALQWLIDTVVIFKRSLDQKRLVCLFVYWSIYLFVYCTCIKTKWETVFCSST